MKPHLADLAPEPIGDDTPLRLSVAAARAFPQGGMTERGLRREAARGRLVIERVAGKDYVTLAEIKLMRDKCRREAKARDSGCAPSAETAAASSAILPDGSLSTETISKAHDAALMIVTELSARSRPTSAASTSIKRRKGNVIHPRFR